jgi:hypothetical protein
MELQGIIDMFMLDNGEPDLCLIMTWIALIASLVFNAYQIHVDGKKNRIIAEQNEIINQFKKNQRSYQ